MEPALKPAVQTTRSGVVGVLATAGTFRGRLYNETKERFAGGVKVLSAMADEFVGLVAVLLPPLHHYVAARHRVAYAERLGGLAVKVA